MRSSAEVAGIGAQVYLDDVALRKLREEEGVLPVRVEVRREELMVMPAGARGGGVGGDL